MLTSLSKYLYFFVDKIQIKELDRFLFKSFFENGGYWTGFLIAFAIALIVADVYYFVCGNKFFRLSNVFVWIVVMLLTGGASYYSTSQIYAKKKLENDLQKIVNRLKNEAKDVGSDDAIVEAQDEATAFGRKWVKEIKKPHAKIRVFGFMNMVYTMLFFFLFSVLFKNHTIHAKAIPFASRRN